MEVRNLFTLMSANPQNCWGSSTEESNSKNQLIKSIEIDAQNDLIQATNSRTTALVRHTIARLQFWRDMGILYIKEDGNWEEVGNAG